MKLFGRGLLLFPTRKAVSQRSRRAAGQTHCKLRKTEEGPLDRLGSLELQGKTILRAGEKMDPHVLLIFVLDRQDSSGPEVSAFLNPRAGEATDQGLNVVKRFKEQRKGIKEKNHES